MLQHIDPQLVILFLLGLIATGIRFAACLATRRRFPTYTLRPTWSSHGYKNGGSRRAH